MGSLDDLPKVAGEDSVTVVPSLAVAAALAASFDESLSVLVLSPTFIASYALPESGEVTIGRSNSVEIYVDDPLVSRRHAIISTAPRPAIRDLGSSNGTRVDGVQLPAGETRELAVGDVVTVGSAALLIQRGDQLSWWLPRNRHRPDPRLNVRRQPFLYTGAQLRLESRNLARVSSFSD